MSSRSEDARRHTPSGAYGPQDLARRGFDLERDLGEPGTFPFTRGAHATGYLGRPWTMRMFSGFGSAEETNQRLLHLLEVGETGLSIAFDLPTLMGYDHDDAPARGEWGRCGVAISSLRDMERLFAGIQLGEVSTSMTINGPAAVLFAMYVALADQAGVPRTALRGTLQNDILKEYIAQNEYIFPPGPSMRLVVDTIEFATAETPLFNPISVSGYHIREAGATAAQELAFTLADGLEYVRWGIERGLPVDAFAPRVSFFFNAHNDLLEEVAKFRAARRMWARALKEQFGARDPRSWRLRFHAQTSGVALAAQEPELNIARVAIQALAATLGGAQSVHTNSLDEALSLPTEHAARIALRTQQVLFHESGITAAVDPLGGSYYLESLTLDLEREAARYIARIDELGGVISAIESDYQQSEIAESAYEFERALVERRQTIVGVNAYREGGDTVVPLQAIDEEGEARHIARLQTLRAHRDASRAASALDGVRDACLTPGENTMPALIEAVRAYCTVGEICAVMRDALGEYVPG